MSKEKIVGITATRVGTHGHKLFVVTDKGNIYMRENKSEWTELTKPKKCKGE